MSAQAVSRITALLALNAEMLRDFMDPDDGEENRVDLVSQYSNQLTEEEGELFVSGDMDAIFKYLGSKLERPTGGEEGDPGGPGG